MATIKDLMRMCDFYPHCNGCPIKPTLFPCSVYRFPGGINEITDKWVAEHLKTYAMDFFEKFPNAQLDSYGAPRACVNAIYGLGDCSKSEISGIICRDCWNQKMKD